MITKITRFIAAALRCVHPQNRINTRSQRQSEFPFVEENAKPHLSAGDSVRPTAAKPLRSI